MRDPKRELKDIRDRLADGLPSRFRRNLEDLGVEAAVEQLENELRDMAQDIDWIRALLQKEAARRA